MARQKLISLPSKVVYPDGTIRLLDDLSSEERSELSKRLTERVEKVVNQQFSLHPEAAKAWLDFHPTYLKMKAEKEAVRKAALSTE